MQSKDSIFKLSLFKEEEKAERVEEKENSMNKTKLEAKEMSNGESK